MAAADADETREVTPLLGELNGPSAEAPPADGDGGCCVCFCVRWACSCPPVSLAAPTGRRPCRLPRSRADWAALWRSLVDALGVPPTLVALLVLTTAAQYYSASTLGTWMFYGLGWSPQQSTMFWTYTAWMEWLSPVVGWAADVLAFRGERRRPAMFVGLAGNCLCWALAWLFFERWPYAACVVVICFQTLFQMLLAVPLNGIVVEAAAAAAARGVSATDPSLLDASAAAEGDAGARRQRRLAGGAAGEGLGRVQARTMLLRTCGSLLGSVAQTVALLYTTAGHAMVAVPAVYTVCLLPVLLLRWRPATRGQRQYARTGLRGRVLGSARLLLHQAKLAVCPSPPPPPPVDAEDGEPVATGAAAPAGASAVSGGGVCGGWAERRPLLGFLSVLVFVFVYTMTPDAGTMYGQYTASQFDFPEWFYSLTGATGLLGSIAGCEAYRWLLAPRNQFAVFAGGCVASALTSATRLVLVTGAYRRLGFTAEVYTVLDGVVVAFFGRIAFMPVLHVAAQRCPPGFEAFVFELFSTAAIGGATIASFVTVRISYGLGISRNHWDGLWHLLVLCSAAKVVPLLLALLLPNPPAVSGLPSSRTTAVGSDGDRSGEEGDTPAADAVVVDTRAEASTPQKQ